MQKINITSIGIYHCICSNAIASFRTNIGIKHPRYRSAKTRTRDALNTSVDFLLNGTKNEKAKAQLKDTELLQQFKEVEQLADKDKTIIKTLIEGNPPTKYPIKV